MKDVCVSPGGSFGRHLFTTWQGGKRVDSQTCLRCGAAKTWPVPWADRPKHKCDGSNTEGVALLFADDGRPMTAQCKVCGRRVTMKLRKGTGLLLLMTHYVLDDKAEAAP